MVKPLSAFFSTTPSIQRRLILINISVTAVALLLAIAMSVTGEYLDRRDYIIDSLRVQARMVGNNTTAALVFGDRNGAEDILRAFSESPEVQSAIIRDKDGAFFSQYSRQREDEHYTDHVPASPDNDSAGKTGENGNVEKQGTDIYIRHVIEFDNNKIGTLRIHADISTLYQDIVNYLIFTCFVALLSFAVATALLLNLRKSITRPLEQLTGAMNTVTTNNDYSIRIDNESDDEFGMLSRGFNIMLAHIQKNDELLERELSERYKVEEHLDTLAYNDVVTGLSNRHYFHKQLDSSVECALTTSQPMALLFLDLDNFKVVNDTAGHKTGDLLLKQASRRLSNTIRSNDYICRIGGDEFAIIIENIGKIADVSTIAEKCTEALSRPFIFDGNKYFIGVSIGISICPDDAITANEVLVNADIAMYEAKSRGKNIFKFYNHAMNEASSQKYHMENQLRHAIEDRQLEVYYQPQIDASTDEIRGAEALLRWNHPVKGMIPPDVFIPIAEESGLIIRLGEWLIDTVCKHATTITKAIPSIDSVSINISAHQIHDPVFIDIFTRALDRTGLDPSCLEIEITESALLDNSDVVIDKVTALGNMGIRTAIDDFGTGFSSISYLKTFPVHRLKIDKSFVSGLPQSEEDLAIVRAIIAMAHGLNIDVIAEGVEQYNQVCILRDYQCNEFQGYYFARPMPLGDFLLNSRTDKQKFAN